MKFDLCMKGSKKSASDKTPRETNTEKLNPTSAILGHYQPVHRPFFSLQSPQSAGDRKYTAGELLIASTRGQWWGKKQILSRAPRSLSSARFAPGIADIFAKNKKTNESTAVYRLGLYGIFPGNFKCGAHHLLNGFNVNFNSEQS